MEFFVTLVDREIKKVFRPVIETDFKVLNLYQSQIDQIYYEFSCLIDYASKETQKFQDTIKPNFLQQKKLNKQEPFEIKSLKKEIRKAYGVYKKNPTKENEIQHKLLKKEFRKVQRKLQYLKEFKDVSRLEHLARQKNKNKFWRFTKNLKKSRSVIKDVTIAPERLLDHYKKFFHDAESNLSVDQNYLNNQVNQRIKSYVKPSIFPFFTADQLSDIIRNLDSSLIKGYDKMSYQLIKKSYSEISVRVILFIFNSILFSGKIPKGFNISIIKPILKDPNKKTDETNNIRPISISNCFAQIFEKLILINSPNLKVTHKNQFGFKPKTSCNHALFTLKETILKYTESNTGIKIASLDAEKAFDKVWRNGLFFKLIDKLSPTLWHILKLYYDSSEGCILLSDNLYSSCFDINVGLKQGGVLSPSLFHVYIDDLIFDCTNANIGALFENYNVSIIVYADDILLLSSCDSQLQKLLYICERYSELWRIKFNAAKSCIVEFGPQVFKNSNHFIKKNRIPIVDKFTYLGVVIDKNLDFNTNSISKFGNVQKAIFAISYLGLYQNSISPHLQAFIYKTYCLSQFTYGLETTVLNKKTRDYLNVSQNNLIRQIIGLKSRCHMSEILKCLKLYNFEDLYIASKLSFLNSIKENEICSHIFSKLILENRKKFSKSFIQDIKLLEKRFDLNIEDICFECKSLKSGLKKAFNIHSGITDSINTCLINHKSKISRDILHDLTKLKFLKEDEEFQELIQYFIITNSEETV